MQVNVNRVNNFCVPLHSWDTFGTQRDVKSFLLATQANAAAGA